MIYVLVFCLIFVFCLILYIGMVVYVLAEEHKRLERKLNVVNEKLKQHSSEISAIDINKIVQKIEGTDNYQKLRTYYNELLKEAIRDVRDRHR